MLNLKVCLKHIIFSVIGLMPSFQFQVPYALGVSGNQYSDAFLNKEPEVTSGQKIRFKKIRYNAHSKKKINAFALTTAETLPFREYVTKFLDPYNFPDRVEIKVSKELDIAKTGRQQIIYTFHIAEYKIDSYEIKANRLADGSVFITGSAPILDHDQDGFTETKIPSISDFKTMVVEQLEKTRFLFDRSQVQIVSQKKCATIRDMNLKRGLCGTVRYASNEYYARVDEDGLASFDKSSFNVTATLRDVYIENSLGAKKDQKVNVKAKNLENSWFKVLPQKGPRVTSNNNEFIYAGDDSSEAQQMHAFSFANRIFDWYDSLGFRGAGRQITIYTGFVSDKFGTDNAVFLPDQYEIQIGIGSGGNGYTKMGLDIDVVAHEVGHFIVYQGINKMSDLNEETKDHTKAIHEGLADYFTYASTGDACLAESICQGSTICFNNCLRSGKSSDISKYKYGSDAYYLLSEPHLKGMIVSAMLWEARNKQSGEDYFQFDQIVLNALDFVPSGGLSYGDLVLGIMASDKEISGGKFCADIYQAAQSYNIDQLFDGDCNDFNDPAQPPDKDRIVDTSKEDEDAYINGIYSDNPTYIAGQAAVTKNGTMGRRRTLKKGCSISAKRDGSVNWLLVVLVSSPLTITAFRTAKLSTGTNDNNAG